MSTPPKTHRRPVDSISHGMRIMIDGTASTVRGYLPTAVGWTHIITYDDRHTKVRSGGAIDCPSF